MLAVGLAGCPGRFGRNDPYANLGQAKDIVTTAVERIGGLDAWRDVGRVRASATVTTYERGGPTHVNRQQQTIYLHAEKLVATARTGEGSWRAVARADGRCKVRAKGFAMDPRSRERICDESVLMLRRVFGPLDLLDSDREVGPVTKTRLEGEDLVRVGARGVDGVALAYYFQALSGELRFVTAGEGQADGRTTVTTYTYMMLPNGMAFPQHIRVVAKGRNVLVGDRPILDVRYTNVEIR